jgi:leader peptidase (prepilin peptidase)/N-methyltransferase
MIGLVATALGLVLGRWTRRTLAELGYRTDEEQALPRPGPQHWITWTSGLAVGSIATWIAGTNSWPLAPVLLPLTLAGPALAAIDLDVMRLPNNILGPVAIITLTGLTSTIATEGRPDTVLRGAAGALLAGGAFWLLSAITRGGIGFGDVKLAGIIGGATGTLSFAVGWWAALIAALSALVWARVGGRTPPVAYGPWLLLGCWIATLVAGAR